MSLFIGVWDWGTSSQCRVCRFVGSSIQVPGQCAGRSSVGNQWFVIMSILLTPCQTWRSRPHLFSGHVKDLRLFSDTFFETTSIDLVQERPTHTRDIPLTILDSFLPLSGTFEVLKPVFEEKGSTLVWVRINRSSSKMSKSIITLSKEF